VPPDEIRAVLAALKEGRLSPQEAEALLLGAVPVAAGAINLDIVREGRTGTPEVVYGATKSAEQVVEALARLAASETAALATGLDDAKGTAVVRAMPAASWFPTAGVVVAKARPERRGGIAVVSAGTSDGRVASEAAVVAEALGNAVLRIDDVGVAGLHRLMARITEIRACRVVIVVAGMDGALPGVLGGLVAAPVVAVPTSVGYGTGLGGLAAMLTMLNACSPGVAVVNIDNGFGAAVHASLINRAGP
jgi:NCAIR mutase (PurE)-related protein